MEKNYFTDTPDSGSGCWVHCAKSPRGHFGLMVVQGDAFVFFAEERLESLLAEMERVEGISDAERAQQIAAVKTAIANLPVFKMACRASMAANN